MEDAMKALWQTNGNREPDHMQAALAEATRLRDEGEGRRTQTLDFLNRGLERTARPSMDEATIRRMYSRSSDQTAASSQSSWRGLMGHLGASGVGFDSGIAFGAGADIQATQRAQNMGEATNLRIARAQQDSLDSAAQFQREMQVSGVMNEDPNATLLQALAGAGATDLAERLGEMQLEGARAGADATENAGKMSALGSVFGGIIPG